MVVSREHFCESFYKAYEINFFQQTLLPSVNLCSVHCLLYVHTCESESVMFSIIKKNVLTIVPSLIIFINSTINFDWKHTIRFSHPRTSCLVPNTSNKFYDPKPATVCIVHLEKCFHSFDFCRK